MNNETGTLRQEHQRSSRFEGGIITVSDLSIHIFSSGHRKGILGYRKTNGLLKKVARLPSRLKEKLHNYGSVTTISRETLTLDICGYGSHSLFSASYMMLSCSRNGG